MTDDIDTVNIDVDVDRAYSLPIVVVGSSRSYFFVKLSSPNKFYFAISTIHKGGTQHGMKDSFTSTIPTYMQYRQFKGNGEFYQKMSLLLSLVAEM